LPGPPPPLDERPPPAPRTPLQGRGKRVLVVEDDLVSRHLVAVLLKEHGCAVLEAASGQEGIAAATQELPDLILMDVGLPDMSGLEAVRRLRQAEPTQRIPIIALTAYAMKGDREQCFAAGCDDYIAKPVGTSALLKLISEFLERSPAPAA
jgi:CheY-like chemotaxis protein